MTIKTVGELIAELQKLPSDMPVGTRTSDYVGGIYEPTVRVQVRHTGSSDNDRIISDGADLPATAREVVVIR